MLEELERLTEGLVEQACAARHPALDVGLRMNEARRGQQQLTRRMMAAVSELSLYQVRVARVGGWVGGGVWCGVGVALVWCGVRVCV